MFVASQTVKSTQVQAICLSIDVILTCCINYRGFMVGYSLIKLISPYNSSISVFIRKFSMMIYRLLSSLSGIYPPIYTNGTWAWVRKREQHLWAFISLLYTHTHPPPPPAPSQGDTVNVVPDSTSLTFILCSAAHHLWSTRSSLKSPKPQFRHL